MRAAACCLTVVLCIDGGASVNVLTRFVAATAGIFLAMTEGKGTSGDFPDDAVLLASLTAIPIVYHMLDEAYGGSVPPPPPHPSDYVGTVRLKQKPNPPHCRSLFLLRRSSSYCGYHHPATVVRGPA